MSVSDDLPLPKSISYIFDELERNGVFYWLDAGTLLKGVRDNTILTSSDIDIAVHGDEVDGVLKSLINIKEKKYRVQYNGGCLMLEDLVTIFLPYPVNRISSIDIYIYHRYNDSFIRRSYHKPLSDSKSKYLFYLSKKIINSGNCDNNQSNIGVYSSFQKTANFLVGRVLFYLYEQLGETLWYVVPKQYFLDFTSFQLYSRSFNIPKHYKKYLRFRYGDSWKTPCNRSEWILSWKKNKNHVLIPKKLSRLVSIKKYWIDRCI
jgi:phosphorylcholine metabolism protein LicD